LTAKPTVGVVIRTLNESALLGQCLDSLRRQKGFSDLDVVVVDSGSTDATLEIARAHGARIVNLPPGEFNYSSSLNLGIEEARGELVLSLSAHAIPVDDDWLVKMAAAFDDAQVAGVACRQIPWPDAPWQEAHRLSHQFPTAARVYARESEAGLVFSNAASVIRRSAWREHRFMLPAAEDLEWAQRVVANGWTIVYEPEAPVYHSHSESPRAQAQRMIDINRVPDVDAPRRTLLRTTREGIGILLRDGRKILGLDEPARRKAAYLAELTSMAFYYVVDFSRSGTTAERRREESKRQSRPV
jgi:rhamnosyltransferase